VFLGFLKGFKGFQRFLKSIEVVVHKEDGAQMLRSRENIVRFC